MELRSPAAMLALLRNNSSLAHSNLLAVGNQLTSRMSNLEQGIMNVEVTSTFSIPCLTFLVPLGPGFAFQCASAAVVPPGRPQPPVCSVAFHCADQARSSRMMISG